MVHVFRPQWIYLFLGGLALARPVAAENPWRAAAELRFNEARSLFQSVKAPLDLPSRFGLALVQLNVQPRTDDNIARARQLFAEIVAAAPGSEYAIRSRYYLGRIEQLHRPKPDWTLAGQIYEALIREHPEHPYAQMAIVKLALIRLYDVVPAEEKRRRFAHLETLAPLVTDPMVYRDYHYIMGVAYIGMEQSPSRALEHLLKAERAGIVQARTRASVYVRIGELARLQADSALARTYYEKFLAEFPTEGRTALIRERLAELTRAHQGSP